MVKCQKCGVDLGPAEKVCPICGTPRSSERKHQVAGLPPEICDVLKRTAEALYFAYENPSPAMSPEAYEALSVEVRELAKKLGCKVEGSPSNLIMHGQSSSPELEIVKETVSFPSIKELIKIGV